MVGRIKISFRRDVALEWLESLAEGDNLYFFVGKTDAWPDDNNPPTPVETIEEDLQDALDIVALKRFNPSDVTTAIRRIEWEIGEVYDQYDSADQNLFTTSNFYVLTSDYNVYKCISNNNGAVSTVEPAGTGLSNITTGDGYVWKYMYTVSTADVDKFFTPDWMAVKVDPTVSGGAVDGALENIIITNGGAGYTTATVDITSNTGTGAVATAIITGGVITGIDITNVGSDYDDVQVTITGDGAGAEVRGVISPKGGHGFDAVSELGCRNLLANTDVIGDEDGDFQVDVSYRKIGLILEPELVGGGLATDATYMGSEIETGTGDIIYISYGRPVLQTLESVKEYNFIIQF